MTKYRPKVVVFDFETALTDGTPSTEHYRPDFRAISCVFAWRDEAGNIKTRYVEGERDIGAWLARLSRDSVLGVVHNFQFEYGVLLHRFPGFQSLVAIDTMRMVQVADNGGKYAHFAVKPQTYDDLLDAAEAGGDEPSYMTGLGLVAAVSRWLPPEYHNHKEPAHKWLRENRGVRKGQEGKHLTELPPELFESYNVADGVVTLLLYERLEAKFIEDEYEWRNDHELYKSSARMIATAKGTGVRVDREALEVYRSKVEAEVAEIEAQFRTRFAREIQEIEARRRMAYVAALKSEKGRVRRAAEIAEDDSPVRFNVGSGKQLRELFVDVLGVEVKFWTKEPKAKPGKERKKAFVPQPSFKSAHLSTYGEGGELLRTRRKRLLVLQQTKALLGLSRQDGMWHMDLRACGTATGRFSGGTLA